MKTVLRIAATMSTAAMIALVAISPARAAEPTASHTGRDFADHVVMMAQGMGFSGQHNPGMHQGFAGWADHSCG